MSGAVRSPDDVQRMTVSKSKIVKVHAVDIILYKQTTMLMNQGTPVWRKIFLRTPPARILLQQIPTRLFLAQQPWG